MFGNNEYWWVALLIFFVFIALNAVIFLLRNKPKLSYAISYGIAAFLLVYKIGENIYWQAVGNHMNFPVEFSAVSYLLFGIFTVFRIKKADTFAIFAAIVAGLMYSVSLWVSPDSFVADGGGMYWLIMAIINHHALYFGGMLMLANVRKYHVRDCYQQLIGVALLVGYSWIIHLFTEYSTVIGKPIIIQITDGSILNWLFSTGTPSTGALVGYYIFAVVMFCLIFAGFYFLNSKCAKRRVKNGLPEDAFPRKLSEVYCPKKAA